MVGRPPSDNPKDARINTRHTPDEKAAWQKAADAQGLELSEFIRAAVRFYIAHLKKQKK